MSSVPRVVIAKVIWRRVQSKTECVGERRVQVPLWLWEYLKSGVLTTFVENLIVNEVSVLIWHALIGLIPNPFNCAHNFGHITRFR